MEVDEVTRLLSLHCRSVDESCRKIRLSRSHLLGRIKRLFPPERVADLEQGIARAPMPQAGSSGRDSVSVPSLEEYRPDAPEILWRMGTAPEMPEPESTGALNEQFVGTNYSFLREPNSVSAAETGGFGAGLPSALGSEQGSPGTQAPSMAISWLRPLSMSTKSIIRIAQRLLGRA